MNPAIPRNGRLQRGAGMVETMVGILVGLLVILVIYSLVSAAENYRRTTTGASDAQITGLISLFVMARDLGNGGNGTMLSSPDLVNCTKNEAGVATSINKPLPVQVTDGGRDEASDTFIAMNSSASRVLWPVDFTADSGAGTNFVVQSPNAFSAPVPSVADPYWVIIAANDGTGRCQLYQIKAASAPDGQGRVTLTPVTPSTITYTAAAPARLINLGPSSLATRLQYESWNTARAEPCGATPEPKRECQLASLDLMTAGATRNPIAANVVLVKVQYGIDITTPNADGVIDCWTAPVAAGDPRNSCPVNGVFPVGYRPSEIQAATLDQLNRIMAVRIAVVVRSDEPDLKDDTLIAANGLRPPVVLFDCPLAPGCAGSITLTAGNGNQIIQDNWRYRVYETVVPLRNSIYIGSM